MAEVAGTISATITALAPDVATLTLADGQTLTWPVSSLPAGSAVGGSVLIMVTQGNRDSERQIFARDLLNEVFHAENNTQS